MSLLNYLFDFSLCLVILLVFYKVFLENEVLHTWKRFYLLVSVFGAFTIPMITFTTYVEPTVLVASGGSEVGLMEQVAFDDESPSHGNYWPTIGWGMYGAGLLIFLLRFIRNLVAMIGTIRNNPVVKKERMTIVLLAEKIIPHTFFRYVFFNKENYDRGSIPEEVLIHEETHASQLHSIDLILVELTQILLWFNPLVYLVKKFIRLNHEFLADQAVLSNGISTVSYQEVLINYLSTNSRMSLTHSVNHSNIIKRFLIMKKQSKRAIESIKLVLIIPVFLIVLFSFSNRSVEIRENESKAGNGNDLVKPVGLPQGNSDSDKEEYNRLAKHYNTYPEADFLVKLRDMWKIRELYKSIPVSERGSLEKYPKSTTSFTLFVDNEGNYLQDDKKVDLDEVDAIFGQLSAKERSNVYVFDDEKDYNKYVAKRGKLNRSDFPPNDVYVFVFSKEYIKKPGNEYQETFERNGVKFVSHAKANKKLESFTANLLEVFKKNGLKVDY